ncbi:hypothetical protein ZPAH1_orf00256 [Aeromonas phage ZPAH1]|nr:hypothetical protein ZPAH1_orf00256 [Aeromonas phage ZPAH1]
MSVGIRPEYPNIVFFKNSDGTFSNQFAWRNDKGRDAEALPIKIKSYEDLEEQCRIVNEGLKYFVCSSCGVAQDEDQFAGFVFAAKYCSGCKNTKKQVASAIKESKQPGFYS